MPYGISIKCHCAECHHAENNYAERHYSECHGASHTYPILMLIGKAKLNRVVLKGIVFNRPEPIVIKLFMSIIYSCLY
jgi:hypothetical protein